MAFVKILELNSKMQKRLEKKLNELENYYAIEKSSFILKEILKISKELLRLKQEEQKLGMLFSNFAKVKKI